MEEHRSLLARVNFFVFGILTLMNFRELVAEIVQDKATLIYISGKTSTGKTTLANQLQNELSYSLVSFDTLVHESVVKKFYVIDVPHAYVVAYRDGEPEEWRESFILSAKNEINSHMGNGIILEGAIANPETLQKIVSEHLSKFFFIYIHPSNLELYTTRIRERFVAGAADNTSGLPKDFWPMLPHGALEIFQDTNLITPVIEKVIQEFALKSQSESAGRLEAMKSYFPNIKVIDLLD